MYLNNGQSFKKTQFSTI